MLNPLFRTKLAEFLASYREKTLVSERKLAEEAGSIPFLPGDTGCDVHPTHRMASARIVSQLQSVLYETGPEAHEVYIHYHKLRDIVSLTIMPTKTSPARLQMSAHYKGGEMDNLFIGIEKAIGADMATYLTSVGNVYALFENILRVPLDRVVLDL